MDLRVLHYFLTVAREQSFTKAAEQLNITQPTNPDSLQRWRRNLAQSFLTAEDIRSRSQMRDCC